MTVIETLYTKKTQLTRVISWYDPMLAAPQDPNNMQTHHSPCPGFVLAKMGGRVLLNIQSVIPNSTFNESYVSTLKLAMAANSRCCIREEVFESNSMYIHRHSAAGDDTRLPYRNSRSSLASVEPIMTGATMHITPFRPTPSTSRARCVVYWAKRP